MTSMYSPPTFYTTSGSQQQPREVVGATPLLRPRVSMEGALRTKVLRLWDASAYTGYQPRMPSLSKEQAQKLAEDLEKSLLL